MADEPTIDPDPSRTRYDQIAIGRVRQLLEQMPNAIGPYRILERIGGGGMGEVYVAEQTSPIKRRVALKVIKDGMDTRQVVARFEAERQALAMMDHPNIAKVFDAGTTDTGRPYFVMELVRGVPVTQYCDDNKLTTRQRVELLIPICLAVQHAHQKGIIHRDIKPSNVLVTLHDGKPVPKVIDFGIAKATSQSLTDKTVYTEFRAMIGTPAYMSPEQAEMSGLDIDTRSDIYSLGVLMYELLTGTTPFNSERLIKAGLLEIQRIIKEEEPPRPSVRLSTMGQSLTDVATHRSIDPARLSRLVIGELDWIVMKALDKDRRRRYDTANDMAADMQRHLSGEPVVAAPPSWGYRTRKFVRRNKASVITTAAVAAALMIGLGVASEEAYRARKERNRAEKANAQVQADVDVATQTLADMYAPDTVKDKRSFGEGFVAAAGSETDLDGNPQTKRSEIETLAFFASRDNKELRVKTDAAELEAYTADLALAQSAMTSGNWPEARARLEACPESKRGWEWNFLRKQAGETKYSMPAVPSAFTADEQRVLMGFDKQKVQLLDTATGDPCGEPFQNIPATGLHLRALSPDGQLAVAAYSFQISPAQADFDDTLQIWDAKTGHPGNRQTVPEGIAGLVFSPDNQHFVTWNHGTTWGWSEKKKDKCTLRIWAAPVCAQGAMIQVPDNVDDVIFSPDGARLLVICGELVSIWDPRTGKQLGVFEPDGSTTPRQLIDQVEFSPDGKKIATASNGILQIWDCPSGRLLQKLIGSPSPISFAIFSADGSRVLTTDVDGCTRLFDPITGKTDWETIIPEVATEAGSDPKFYLHATRTAGGSFAVREFESGMDGYRGFLELLGPNGSKLGGLAIDDLQNLHTCQFFLAGATLLSPREIDSAVDTFSADIAALEIQAACDDSTSHSSTHPIQNDHPCNGKLTTDGIVEIPNPAVGSEPFRIGTKRNPIRAFAFSPDGTRLVTGDDTSIRFYGDKDWNELAVFRNDQAVTGLQFTDDGSRLIVHFADGSAAIWDPRPLAERQRMWARRAAERRPARGYIAKLLADTTTTELADLEQRIRDDSSLTPQRKLAALEMAPVEISQIERAAKPIYDSMCAAQLCRSQVLASAMKVTDPAIRNQILHLISTENWFSATTYALWPIVDRDDEPKERYTLAAVAADELLAMNPETNKQAIPAKATMFGTIGAAYYHVGRYEECIVLNRRAIAVNIEHDKDNDAFCWCRIAMAQFNLGQVEESRNSLKSAIADSGGTANQSLPHVLAAAIKLIDPSVTQSTAKSVPPPGWSR